MYECCNLPFYKQIVSLVAFGCQYTCSAKKDCVPELIAVGRPLTGAATVLWVDRMGEANLSMAIAPCLQELGKELMPPRWVVGGRSLQPCAVHRGRIGGALLLPLWERLEDAWPYAVPVSIESLQNRLAGIEEKYVSFQPLFWVGEIMPSSFSPLQFFGEHLQFDMSVLLVVVQ